MAYLRPLLRFILIEVLIKSIMLCLVTTFLAYLLLCAAPVAEKREVPIRGEFYGTKSAALYDAASQGNDKSGDLRISYTEWVRGILKGDLGGTASGQGVAEEVGVRLPVTVTLSFASFAPAALISLLLGLHSARGRVGVVRNATYVIASLPAFLIGYLLFGIFGASFLAAIATLGLSCGVINEMGRIVRRAMETEKGKEYIETARAKGLREAKLPSLGTVEFHAFRGALITIIPSFCAFFTLIISGSMVVEQVFRLPGLSYMLIDGLTDKDTGRVLIVILLVVLMVRIVSVLGNALYLFLNPRYGYQ
jgi:ABC-type dipeptide/oligopeptide/nickel transport system permease component